MRLLFPKTDTGLNEIRSFLKKEIVVEKKSCLKNKKIFFLQEIFLISAEDIFYPAKCRRAFLLLIIYY